MLAFVLIQVDTVYVDEGIIGCMEIGDSACVESYEMYESAVRFMRDYRYDSATTYLMRSIRSLDGHNLLYWKVYLYGLLYFSATMEWKVIKSSLYRRDTLREFMDKGWELSWKVDSTMGLYLRCSHHNAEISMFTGKVEGKHIHNPLKLSKRVYTFKYKRPIAIVYHMPLWGRYLSEYVPVICDIGNKEAGYPYLKKWFADSTYDLIHKIAAASRLLEIYANRGMTNTARYYVRWLSSIVDTSSRCNYICRISIYNFLGDVHGFKLSDFMKARYYYARAFNLVDSAGMYDTWLGAVVANNHAIYVGDNLRALELLRYAYNYNSRYYGESDGLANVMANMYHRFLDLGWYDSAEVYINRIVRIREKVRGKRDPYTLTEKTGMAIFYLRKGDTLKAREIAREVIRDFNTKTFYWPWSEWVKKRRLLTAYRIAGDLKKALEIGEEMLRSKEMSPYYRLKYGMYIAYLYTRLGDSLSAIHHIREVFDSLPNAVHSMARGTRELLYTYMMHYWEKLIPSLVKWRPGDAAKYSEMLKARLLSEEKVYMSDYVVDSLTRLLNRRIAEGAADEELMEIEIRISDRMDELSAMMVGDGFPEIPGDAAFLGYLVLDNMLLEYMISSRDTVVMVQEIPDDSLKKLVNRLNENPDDGRTSSTLYGLLLSGFDSLLNDYRHVAISRHGILNYLNFSILRDGKEYVIEKPYAIYNVLSLYTFGYPCRVEGEVFAIGRNEYGDNPVVLRSEVGNLKYAEREAKDVAHIMGGDYLVGDSLKEIALYRANLEQYDILHIATHALVDSLPEVVLGPEEDTTLWNNNILTTYEIMARLRSGKMVVLSGCRTGYGRIINDWEGIDNLVRAFIYTGAKCVLTTSWDVSDLASYVFMRQFYRLLKSGETADMALRDAQLYMLRSTGLSSPFFWGPFSITVFR